MLQVVVHIFSFSSSLLCWPLCCCRTRMCKQIVKRAIHFVYFAVDFVLGWMDTFACLIAYLPSFISGTAGAFTNEGESICLWSSASNKQKKWRKVSSTRKLTLRCFLNSCNKCVCVCLSDILWKIELLSFEFLSLNCVLCSKFSTWRLQRLLGLLLLFPFIVLIALGNVLLSLCACLFEGWKFNRVGPLLCSTTTPWRGF